ncbi:MAG: hypothetical protein JWP97_2922 [Labilithrix sp.]|nr:hypothetical protein [Labilithrix sp.]
MTDLANARSSSLAMRTLRTALVLVAACVLFVGVLSVVAVVVTSRAVGGAPSGPQATEAADAAKKPLSI